MTQEERVLQIVKQRLGLGDDTQDDLIGSYVTEIGRRILHYCNLVKVPDEVQYTWAAMTIDALRIEQPNLPGIVETSAAGEQIKVGDTSTAPARPAGLTNATKSVIDAVVMNYRVDLNRYRKLRW
ncbi:phage head-tail connector protein [Paenibacillus naphthalenovorans]|uniref:phage head-tail connector protein n=1 Tax=Paenibacillus naphthalenovorans TaxID=162209 RepID=UPI003D2A0F5C